MELMCDFFKYENRNKAKVFAEQDCQGRMTSNGERAWKERKMRERRKSGRERESQ